MIITELNNATRIRLSIKSVKTEIAQLKREIRQHTGEYRDWLYLRLDDACERLNKLQRKANRMGVAV